jgi:hypothetical protein
MEKILYYKTWWLEYQLFSFHEFLSVSINCPFSFISSFTTRPAWKVKYLSAINMKHIGKFKNIHGSGQFPIYLEGNFLIRRQLVKQLAHRKNSVRVFEEI